MIIALSGKIKSGKDTVGEIIQILLNSPHFKNSAVISFLGREHISDWEVKKFADKLKDIVCILLNCTRENLENQSFKEKKLGEEWWYYGFDEHKIAGSYAMMIPYLTNGYKKGEEPLEYLVKLTPRALLQLLGTECGRQIIHPDIWVNALMGEYKPNLGAVIKQIRSTTKLTTREIITEDWEHKSLTERIKHLKTTWDKKNLLVWHYPTWIITDMRFPNEVKAVKKRKGITIRVNRWIKEEFTKEEAKKLYSDTQETIFGIDDNEVESEIVSEACFDNYARFATEISYSDHPSETALDDHKFDFVIDNNGSLSDLVDKVREILNEIQDEL